MSKTMRDWFTQALNDGFNRPVLKVDLGAQATDVPTYLRMLDIPPVPQVIVWEVRETEVWFIGDPGALTRIREDRARVIQSYVGPSGAIVELITSTCSCPGEMLERGRHLPTCGAR